MTILSKDKQICPFCKKPTEINEYGFMPKIHLACEHKIIRFKKIGIDKRFWRLPKFRIEAGNKTAFEAVEEFIKNPTKGLFLFGQAGTGKTHLVSKIAQKVKKEVEFVKVPRLLLSLKANFNGHGYRNEQIINRLSNVEILILDDLGAEKTSEWVTETLYILIDERYSNMKTTIFTSNYHLSDLVGRLGDRVVSRILEMCRVIEIKTSDKRKDIAISEREARIKGVK